MPSLRHLLRVDPYGNLWSDRRVERLRKVLSPRYVIARIGLTIEERRHPGRPWLTRDAIAWLDEHLRPEHRGFEWGSGHGTIWFAERVASWVCVEHHPDWAAEVRRQLAARGRDNVDQRVVDEDRYLEPIDEFPDGHFDLVLVDGLFRDEALLRSMPKLRSGGWLVFDNVNWYLPSASRTPHSRSFADGPESEAFARAWEELRRWPTTWTSNGVNDTAVFVKP